MKKKAKPVHEADKILVVLSDDSIPWPHRAAMLRDIFAEPTPETEKVARLILESLGEKNAEALHQEKIAELRALIKEIQEGPIRSAVFLGLHEAEGKGAPKALVSFDDGALVYPVIANASLAAALRVGDRVLVEARGKLVLDKSRAPLRLGETARFERVVNGNSLEVTLRDNDSIVVLAAADLLEQVRNGAVEPGARVVINQRQGLALAALPPQDSLSHYRFLDRSPIPDVVVERDIGAPEAVIGEVHQHVREELANPLLRRQFRIRPSLTRFLTGVSGSGKTLSINAMVRLMYLAIAEFSGLPLAQIPSRLFRVRSSQLLNMYLGQSDRNIDRLWDEVEKMASTPVVMPDGRSGIWPAMVIIEEVEGLSRVRGSDHEAIYDRLQTVLLQRLDPARPAMKQYPIIVLASTNEPGLCDPAFIRRCGGGVTHFGRLKRNAFKAVLQKHLDGLPLAPVNGHDPTEISRLLNNQLTAWLFSPRNPEPAIVELALAGAPAPVVKHRRDFLTGSLVDRAVQKAASEAYLPAAAGGVKGVTLEQLMRAIHEQIMNAAACLTEHNARSYLDLPDGARVASLRRLPQPPLLPIEYLRP